MTRYLSDQNKVVYLFESGTYAGSITQPGPTASTWLGQVQEFSLTEEENKIETRYLGNNSRSVASFEDGPRDVTATLTYNPQDMNLFFHAIGSVCEGITGTTNIVKVSQINSDSIQNPFVSGTTLDLSTPYSFAIVGGLTPVSIKSLCASQ